MKFITYNPKLQEITGDPWHQAGAFDLPGVLKDAYAQEYDYSDVVGMPDKIFTKTEYRSAEMRAELMDMKRSDVVVTLVVKTIFKGPNYDPAGSLYIEPVLYSQMEGRIEEMRKETETNQTGATMKVSMAFSEETSQVYYFDDIPTSIRPRLPKYDQEYDKKRKGYRSGNDE